MVTIKIDKQFSSDFEIVDYLNYVAKQIEEGFVCGEGWDKDGKEETL